MASINPISGNLSRQQAAHLLRRTTFGPTKEEIDSFTNINIDTALALILKEYDAKPEPPIDPLTGETWLNPARTDINTDDNDLISYLMAWWMELMRNNGANIIEKMTHFYHTHFTTKRSVVDSSTSLYYQIALFRHYALGNFKELSSKICLDNAMIRFLDSNSNVAGAPQENYAREFLELYTIGKGNQIGPEDYTNYTETDIQEAARVLSGYDIDTTYTNIDPDTELPRGIIKTNSNVLPQDPAGRALKHDEGVKIFSGSLGNGGTTIEPNAFSGEFATIEAAYQELDDLVEMIFARDETPKSICRELYRYFVYYDITDEIEADIITPMANTFLTNDFEVLPVLEQLFKSEHFYDLDTPELDDNTKGGIIKSPLELFIGCIRFFKVDFGDLSDTNRLYEQIYSGNISGILRDEGLTLYEPFEVAGYSAYHQRPEFNRHWITASNLGYRYKQIDDLIIGFTDGDNDPLGVALDVMKIVEDTNYVADPSDPNQILDMFIEHLFPQVIRTERYEYFRDRILLDNLSIANWFSEWSDYKTTNDDSGVRPQIEALVRELVQTPEYQLF